jgi:hypothetical protein
MAWVNVDIDLEDITDDLSRRDKIKLLNILIEDLDYDAIRTALKGTDFTNIDMHEGGTFESAIRKLLDNRWRLPLADEDYILNLANKL